MCFGEEYNEYGIQLCRYKVKYSYIAIYDESYFFGIAKFNDNDIRIGRSFVKMACLYFFVGKCAF